MYRCIVYSDSISQGTGATSPIAQGWHAGFCDLFPGVVYFEAGGSRRAYDDWATAANRVTSARRFARVQPHIIINNIGVNDWGTNPQTLANFQTMFQDAIAQQAAANPAAKIFATTMFFTLQEAAVNGEGKTIPQYRTGIINACAATGLPASQLVVLNGDTDFALVAADISGDNLHENTRGHGKIASNYIRLLGLGT